MLDDPLDASADVDRLLQRLEARDLELINKSMDDLNAEVEDVLDYQATEP
jgi:hypothetical protein